MVDLGRSIKCPMEAVTLYLDPSILLIVFTLAGDSTMTKILGMLIPYIILTRQLPDHMF